MSRADDCERTKATVVCEALLDLLVNFVKNKEVIWDNDEDRTHFEPFLDNMKVECGCSDN